MFTLIPWPTRQMQRFQIYCRGLLQVQITWLFSTRLPRERRIYYSLCCWLRKLTVLESVKIKESWGCWHAGQYSISRYRVLYGIGSPLFRFWNPFHAYPGSWHIGLSLDLDPVHDADGPWQFRLLNYALSQMRRTFRTFKHADQSEISPCAFDTRISMAPKLPRIYFKYLSSSWGTVSAPCFIWRWSHSLPTHRDSSGSSRGNNWTEALKFKMFGGLGRRGRPRNFVLLRANLPHCKGIGTI